MRRNEGRKMQRALSKNALDAHDATNVAKYVIARANMLKIPITHLKLQKTLYYLQGVMAKECDERLFDNAIYAWPYGPVVKDVYGVYCMNGALPLCEDQPIELNLTDAELRLVDREIDRCLAINERQLVNQTHAEQPWKDHKDEVWRKPLIEYKEIRRYFRGEPV